MFGRALVNRDDEIVGGIVIEADPEKLVIKRSAYSILNFIVDIGGFSLGLFFFFKCIHWMFKCSSLEGRLIKNLFKAQLPYDKIDVRNREEAEKSGLNKDQIAVIDAIEAAEHRQIIAPSSENPIIRCFRTRCGSRNDIIGPNDFAYFKAKLRLHRELDVTKLVKNLRNIRNMLQFMTTRGERRLNRMQADKNMVIIGMKEKTVL